MAAFSSGDALNAIVADIGQSATKIGFAGEDYPRSYFRSNVAVLREDAPKKDGSKSSSSSNNNNKPAEVEKEHRRPIQDVKYDYYTRPICSSSEKPEDWHDGNWEVHNPVNSTTGLWYDPEDTGMGGRGADWSDLVTTMIRHGFKSALGTEPENHPFLLAERSYNPPPLRQQMLECLFEDLKMPAVFLARDATLACYACGRTTGTVVDMGYGGTTVTPVYEGYVEQKGIRRSPIGTLDMDERILKAIDHLTKKPFMPIYQIRRQNHAKRIEPFHHLARLHVAQQCREEGAGAAVDTTATAVAFAAPHVPFQLPDGQSVNIPSVHRYAVANLLLGQDDESAQHREEAMAVRKKKLSEHIAETTHLEDDTGEEEEQFTEAAAVGIPSARRGRSTRSGSSRGGSASAKKLAAVEEEKKKQQRRSFSNRHLQKACIPYLQAHMEHMTSASLAAMVPDAAFRCDRDQQASLLGNLVLAGGGACLGPTDQSVPDYLRTEVEAIIHTHTPGWRVKVLSPGIQERSICSWLGGSILGSLGTFHDMWITRADYDEYGTAIVNRKCP